MFAKKNLPRSLKNSPLLCFYMLSKRDGGTVPGSPPKKQKNEWLAGKFQPWKIPSMNEDVLSPIFNP